MLAGKIAYNFLASSIGRIVGLFFSFASLAVITRALSVDGYGKYSTILAFLYLFSGIADMGLYSLMLRELSRPKANEKYVAGTFFTVRLISSVVFLGIASLLIFCFPYPREIKIGAALGSLGFIFMSLSQVLMPIFQKYLKTDRAAVAEVSGKIINFFLIFLFFKIGFGILWFVFALIFGCAAAFFVNLFFARKYVKFCLNFDFGYFKEILKLTYPIALSIIFTMIYFRGNTILLSLFQSQRDVGIFNLGYRALENLIFFPAVMTGLIMPFLAFNAVKNIKFFNELLQKSFNVFAMGALPVVFGGFFAAPFVVAILGGKDFVLAVLPLRILLVATAFIFFGNLIANSLIALNRQKDLMKIYFLGAVFSVGANLFLIPKYSYNGVALAAVFTELLVTALMFLAIFKETRWIPSLGPSFKAIVASALMCLPLAFLSAFASPIILSLIFGVSIFIYFLTLYFLKGITKEEIATVIKMGK